ncbi:MAG: GGDEF domain-containing protein [Bdellovibrionales bacterium]|nr:GGDEF domain-containing protein [Bdellovibrionales bacterium]
MSDHLQGVPVTAEDVEQLRKENSALRRENARLRQELVTDELTGLFNSRHLADRLEECIEEILAARGEPALLFIDVDHFKAVNEQFGHQAGSRVLRQMGRLIANLVRDDDIAFRYAGDEFVVLVSGGRKGAGIVAERIRAAIEAHEFRVRGMEGLGTVRVTVSIGMRSFKSGDSAESILREADRAMFEAKRRSRNTLAGA